MTSTRDGSTVRPGLGGVIFLSRWLQAPLYLGLIIAQAAYVCQFMLELWHANVLKVKLAMAIIGISSIHLLRTFIQAQSLYVTTPHAGQIILWQTVIHLTFIVSAVALAWIDRCSRSTASPERVETPQLPVAA